jgi:hypothetical protein
MGETKARSAWSLLNLEQKERSEMSDAYQRDVYFRAQDPPAFARMEAVIKDVAKRGGTELKVYSLFPSCG